jgi:uncharacterized protein (AIM24 family)
MNCKLVGNFVQHLEVTLSPREEFYAEKGALIYIESGIQKEVGFNGNSLGRILGAKISGESLFIVRFINTTNVPRKLVIGSKHGLHPVKLNGESMICQSGAYVASNNKVDINTKISISGIVGGMGVFLQKITGNSTVFLDTNGVPITIDLNYGDSIEVDENHIIGLHGISESQLSSSWSLKNVFGGEGLSLMKIAGPGKVYLSPGTMMPIVNN